VLTQFAGAAPPAISALNGILYLAAGAVFDWDPEAIVLSNGLPYPAQTVTWSATSGATVASPSTSTDSNGIAWTQVISGALAAGGVSTVNACLAGGVPNGKGCTEFTIVGDDPSTAGLISISGTSQTLGPTDVLAPAILGVVDSSGNPLAGAQVSFYQTLRQWAPPCPAQGSCPPAPVLATQTVQAVSGANGSVTLNPLTDGIVATQLEVLAVTGSSATLTISVDRHP